MRDQKRHEGLHDARDVQRPADKPRPIDSRYFTPTEEIARAFEGAPRIDFKRFREDIDAFVDPSPREWPFRSGSG